MKYFRFLLLIVSIFTSFNSLAQSGCLLSDGRLFTTYQGGGILPRLYNSSPSISLAPGYCSWGPTSSTSCNVCLGSINVISLVCLGGPVVAGHSGNYTMIQCPIDDYAWLLVLSTASIVLFKIKNNRIK
ncbi:MAG: hypothetical protein EOO43_11550 [Flavobacterium sp.]|nr:MAG: hypothetical protein EOO43_11550 [Flavobacterium sp.]